MKYESLDSSVNKKYINIVFLTNIALITTFCFFALFGVIFGLRFNTESNENQLITPGNI